MKKCLLAMSMGLLMLPTCLQAKWFESDNSQINVGSLFNFARYNLGCLPKIEGYLIGLHADYIYGRPHCLPISCWYATARFDGVWNAGPVCGDDALKLKIRDFRTEFDLGYNFNVLCQDVYVTPLVGVGFYSLRDIIQPSLIQYHYRNLYVPVGVDLLWRCNSDIQVELQAVYRINAHTRLQFKACDLSVCEKLELCRTRGVHVELPISWFPCWRLSCFGIQTKMAPFFDWNEFGRAKEASDMGVCDQIPQLKRWYLGWYASVGVNF